MVEQTADESRQEAADTLRGIGLGYVVYQQVAGVLGAFALIAFLRHYLEIDWRGALLDLISVWDAYVRPAVKVILDSTIRPNF